MDTDNNGQQPITDDAELAKVLEGMNPPAADAASGLQFEEAPLPTPAQTDDNSATTDDAQTPTADPVVAEEPATSAAEPVYTPVAAPASDLDSIKKDALEELRPLVDKLNLPADEKFDTLLLLIRSTDDQSLLGAAHTAAKAIEDEAKRAQALLDIIKEIDFFANQPK